MERKYPTKYFPLFVLTNFLFHYFWLFIPGIIFCFIGIWKPTCLWIGLVILALDLILSIVEQLRITKAAVSHSDNPEFNELMDAFCSGGLTAFGEVVDEKIRNSPTVDTDEDNT